MDISQVFPKLYTGGAIRSINDVELLKRLGVSHVINCQKDIDDRTFLDNSGIVLFDNSVHDTAPPYPQPAEWFHRSIAFALEVINSASGLFVHCYSGRSRGPSTMYAILRALGNDPQVSEAVIRRSRPQVGMEYIQAAEEAIWQWDSRGRS